MTEGFPLGERHSRLARPLAVLYAAGSTFLGSAGSRKGSQLAFHLLLAAPAALVFGIWILSGLDHSGQVREAIVESLMSSLPLARVAGEQELTRTMDALTRGAGTVGVLSVPVLLYSTSSALAALRFTVEMANGGLPESHGFLRMRSQDLLLVLIGMPVLVLISVFAVSSAVGAELGRAPLVGRFIYSAAGPAFLFSMGTVTLILLFRVLDLGRSTWEGALWGGLVAGVGAILITWGLTLWFSVTGGGSVVYGILAAFMGLMIYAYLLSNAIAFGAFVAAELAKPGARD